METRLNLVDMECLFLPSIANNQPDPKFPVRGHLEAVSCGQIRLFCCTAPVGYGDSRVCPPYRMEIASLRAQQMTIRRRHVPQTPRRTARAAEASALAGSPK